MTTAQPSLVKTVDGVAHTDNDGTDVADETSGATDGNTVTSFAKVGKSPEDLLRVEFTEDRTILSAGDTIDIIVTALHNVSDIACIPYNAVTGVDVTNEVVQTSVSTGSVTFTLSAGFISALADQGSDSWACRIIEDNWDASSNTGDYSIAEIAANLTTNGAPVVVIHPDHLTVHSL